MFEYSTLNHPYKAFNRISWGVHINPTRYEKFSPEFPDWLNPLQKQDWRYRGLVVWDATIQVVAHLYANYALRILETMKDTDTWKTNGYVIGSPIYRMSILETPDKQSVPIECHQDGWVLINKISLSPERAEEFLNFLTTEEAMLFLIATDEDKDVREACAMVVELLVGRERKNLRECEIKASNFQRKVGPISS